MKDIITLKDIINTHTVNETKKWFKVKGFYFDDDDKC